MEKFDFINELQSAAQIDINWSKIDNKTILVTGATGLIGTYLINVLATRNNIKGTNTKIVALSRNKEKFETRFSNPEIRKHIEYLSHDIQQDLQYDNQIDYIVHLASNTHPMLYATDPIGTELANILGTNNLLKLASTKQNCTYIMASSTDIYGHNNVGKEYLTETDYGYVDPNTLRAGYIEGKRASEALCNAYKEAKGVDFMIARFCRLYGKTVQLESSLAIHQFIKKAANNEDVVLKSAGTQTFSYLYVYDAVTALLTIMANGESGNAYNVADNNQVFMLKQLAAIAASSANKEVIFDLPNETESKGASTFQNVKLDGSKLASLGWKCEVDINEGLPETIRYIREIYKGEGKC